MSTIIPDGNEKVNNMIHLFEEILVQDSELGKKIVAFFLKRLKEQGLIVKQGSLETFSFENNGLDRFQLKKLTSQVLFVMETLKIKLNENQNYYLIDEVAVFKLDSKLDIQAKPLYFMTMIEDRKPKNQPELAKLKEKLQEDVRPLLQKLNKSLDRSYVLDVDNSNEKFDAMVKNGNYLIAFNNYSFSIKQLGDKYNIQSDTIASEIQTIKID